MISPTNVTTLLHRIEELALSSPDRPAVTFLEDRGGIRSLTYGELLRRTNEIAAALARQAVPKARALLLFDDPCEFAPAFLGCLRAAIIAVPSSLPRRAAAIQHVAGIAQDAEASLILTTRNQFDSDQLAKWFGSSKIIFTDETNSGPQSTNLPTPSPSDVAFLQFSSGSTGSPLGVIVSHANLIANLETIHRAAHLSEISVVVSWLPLFHDMGLVGMLLSPLFVGGHAVLLSSDAFLRKPVRWLQAISHYRGTSCGGPNFAFDLCAQRIREEDKTGLDLSSWKVAFNGAEPIQAGTLERFSLAFRDQGFTPEAFFSCYGLAESTLMVSGGPHATAPTVLHLERPELEQGIVRRATSPGHNNVRKVVACGSICEGMIVRIVAPESGCPCADGVVGEIWVGGQSVSTGYWNKPVETSAAFGMFTPDGEGPFLRTGDLGFLDDGELFVTGRLKDLIILRGRNIYPQDVERIAERSFEFTQPGSCAAFSHVIDDGERLCLMAEGSLALRHAVRDARKFASDTVRQGRTLRIAVPDIDTLLQSVRSTVFEELDVSIDLIVLTQPAGFPRTTSGKVRRSECRRMLECGPLEYLYYWSSPTLQPFCLPQLQC